MGFHSSLARKRALTDLETPAGDVEAIAQLLETYGDFQVKRLSVINQSGALRVASSSRLDHLVKVADLEEAIAQLFNPEGDSILDTALLFFAGHGLRKSRGGVTEGFLATSNTDPSEEVWGLSLK